MAKDSRISHFIDQIIADDLDKGANDGRVLTRFPPEPNGYLHIGHAKSICLNFISAEKFGGSTTLRFDDTNPTTENIEFVNSIQSDIKWLGFDWEEKLFFASDYFPQLYDLAEDLIKAGKAFVDSSSEAEIRELRGTVMEPGVNSPYRDRSVEENLDLLRRMKAGEFEDGAHVLRAKIDMSADNMLMRDPLLYRIRKAHHYRTGNDWCIYPMYDYAHPLSDALEGTTHSICTLEFEVHRELYDWLIDNLELPHRPHQYEFARLNPEYTVTSKRKLKVLVGDGHVSGWDDPRMPTLAGLRRRGILPKSIRTFCEKVGVSKTNSRTDPSLFDYCVREDLDDISPRRMVVSDPLKIVLTNWEEGKVEMMEAKNFPPSSSNDGTRKMPFERELLIEKSDFSDDPPAGFKRLIPGGEVRLKHGYIVKCEEVVRNNDGSISHLLCTYDPDTRSGSDTSGKKIKGTIHWVASESSIPVELRVFDRLFTVANPNDVEEGKSFLDFINPDSLKIFALARAESSISDTSIEDRFQFERIGYFTQDSELSKDDALVYNLIVSLKDNWKGKSDQDSKKEKQKVEEKSKPQVVELTDEQLKLRDNLLSEFQIDEKVALVIAESDTLEKVFRETVGAGSSPVDAANWVVNDLKRIHNESGASVDGIRLSRLIELVENDVVSVSVARGIFDTMSKSQKTADEIIEAESLGQISDLGELQTIVDEVLSNNSDKVEIYLSGKTGVLGFLVGQVMQETGGKANPKMVKDILTSSIK